METMKEFKLPEKWCVRREKTNDSVARYFNKRFNVGFSEHGCHNSLIGCNEATKTYKWFYVEKFDKNYTEITIEQFKKYVVKENNMNKEIIGYKLIKPEYRLAVENIAYNYSIASFMSIATFPTVIARLKEAGVLDLWFEPVYKETKILPKINGYEGKLEGNYVVYGCAKFTFGYIEELNGLNGRNTILGGNKDIISIKLDSGVEIKIEEIKQIYEYIKSKN